MVKYYNYMLTFSEVPDEISLCFNITNCQEHCHECHSSFLRMDIGNDLSADLQQILNQHHDQFTCVCFLGEGNDKKQLQKLIDYIKNLGYKICVYSGRDNCDLNDYQNLDYYKIGSYQSEYGPLNRPTTNQRMFKKIENRWEDITKEFFPKSLEG